MVQQVSSHIWRIMVGLPESPLKLLNSYLIKTPERNLLIDTGFNRPECFNDLSDGLKQLGVDMSNTDIFVTHLHADHSGLVPRIASPQSTIYMNAIDKQILDGAIHNMDEHWRVLGDVFAKEGYPADEHERARRANPGRNFCADREFDITAVEDGDVITVGEYAFKCVFTPGHTPGHTCLYGESDRVMFTGDHVLFDITPNITAWKDAHDSLACYIKSLNKIKEYPVDLTLTGHRENFGTLVGRANEIIAHHYERLDSARDIIAKHPGITVYDLASKMKWSLRVKGWDDFPPGQKWFAVGEALSHVDYLVNDGLVERRPVDGINRYYCV